MSSRSINCDVRGLAFPVRMQLHYLPGWQKAQVKTRSVVSMGAPGVRLELVPGQSSKASVKK